MEHSEISLNQDQLAEQRTTFFSNIYNVLQIVGGQLKQEHPKCKHYSMVIYFIAKYYIDNINIIYSDKEDVKEKTESNLVNMWNQINVICNEISEIIELLDKQYFNKQNLDYGNNSKTEISVHLNIIPEKFDNLFNALKNSKVLDEGQRKYATFAQHFKEAYKFLEKIDELIQNTRIINIPEETKDTYIKQLQNELAYFVWFGNWDESLSEGNQNLQRIMENIDIVNESLYGKKLNNTQKQNINYCLNNGDDTVNPQTLSDFFNYTYANIQDLDFIMNQQITINVDNSNKDLSLKLTCLQTSIQNQGTNQNQDISIVQQNQQFKINYDGLEQNQQCQTGVFLNTVKFGRKSEQTKNDIQFSQQDTLVSRNQFRIGCSRLLGYQLTCISWTNPTLIKLKKSYEYKLFKDSLFQISDQTAFYVVDIKQPVKQQLLCKQKETPTDDTKQQTNLIIKRERKKVTDKQQIQNYIDQQTENVQQQAQLKNVGRLKQKKQEVRQNVEVKEITIGIDWTKLNFGNMDESTQTWTFTTQNPNKIEFIIGTHQDCDIIINKEKDNKVKEKHAKIIFNNHLGTWVCKAYDYDIDNLWFPLKNIQQMDDKENSKAQDIEHFIKYQSDKDMIVAISDNQFKIELE